MKVPAIGPPTGWTGAMNNGTGSKRQLTVWAICMRHLPDSWPAASGGQSAGPGQSFADVFCGNPKIHVVGGGTSIDGGLRGEIASTLPIDDNSDADTVPDDGWRSWTNKTSGNLTRATSTVCLL